MRILYIHYGEQWIRGSERVLLDLFSRSSALGIEPFLWTNVAPLAQAVREMGFPAEEDEFQIYFDYDSPRFIPRVFVASISRGVALIRRSGAQLIHCNSLNPAQWALPAAWRTNVPVLSHSAFAQLEAQSLDFRATAIRHDR